jgi:hypothetical protein
MENPDTAIAASRPTGGLQRLAGTTAAAAGALVAALALACCIHGLQTVLQPRNERAVLATGFFFAAILAVAVGGYVLRRRREARPDVACLTFLTVYSVLLLAIYFFLVSWYVFFPADIWIWAEGDFVNDILKFSVGYPLYTAPVNGDSFHYVPGPQLLTYLLAWLAGKGGSIPAYRVIQVVYTALAAFAATLCCRRILRMARPESPALQGWMWNSFCYATLLLAATNSITNSFAYNLHADALAQLANLVAFYLLLDFIETRSRRALVAMTLLIPIGFLIKQNILIWGLLYAGFLVLWDRSWKRLAIFVIGASVLLGATIGLCYAMWGQPFLFWVFQEMSKHTVSPLRAFQHALDSWTYFAAVLLGGITLLRGRKPDALFGAWLVSAGLLTVEAYTSGIEWMLNHLGPGSLIACVWFLAGLASVWKDILEPRQRALPEDWIRAGAVAASVALLFSGMGMMRIPLRPVSEDAYRYVRDIERQFQGQDASRVLLDSGTWVYAPNRVIMGDRADVLASQAITGGGDFSGFLSRIAARHYSKILIRNLHEPDCWYENSLWPKPTGIRQALLDNYLETGHIRAAEGPTDVKNWAVEPHLFGEIAILQPKPAPR